MLQGRQVLSAMLFDHHSKDGDMPAGSLKKPPGPGNDAADVAPLRAYPQSPGPAGSTKLSG